jgi:hypothetical protein
LPKFGEDARSAFFPYFHSGATTLRLRKQVVDEKTGTLGPEYDIVHNE